jgi:hypothetical protein
VQLGGDKNLRLEQSPTGSGTVAAFGGMACMSSTCGEHARPSARTKSVVEAMTLWNACPSIGPLSARRSAMSIMSLCTLSVQKGPSCHPPQLPPSRIGAAEGSKNRLKFYYQGLSAGLRLCHLSSSRPRLRGRSHGLRTNLRHSGPCQGSWRATSLNSWLTIAVDGGGSRSAF